MVLCLTVDEGVMRAYNGFMPCSLLGGRFSVITSHITFTGHCVGSLASSPCILFAQHDVTQTLW